MAIKVTGSDVGDVTVVKVSGSVSFGGGDSKELYDGVLHQLQRGRKKIVLDMSEATYLDSSGLGYIVASYTQTKNSGGELVMANPTGRIRELMHNTTKLDRVVTVKDSVEEAVSALEHSS